MLKWTQTNPVRPCPVATSTRSGRRKRQRCPSFGDSWSKATFLRSLREAIFSTGKQVERARERVFDKGVASVNWSLKAGDRAFLDVCGTPAEQTLLERRRTKLYWKTAGPYTVLANGGSTIFLDVYGLPERITSDRIRPALLRRTPCRRKAEASP